MEWVTSFKIKLFKTIVGTVILQLFTINQNF